jgi:hypothetical protein
VQELEPEELEPEELEPEELEPVQELGLGLDQALVLNDLSEHESEQEPVQGQGQEPVLEPVLE